MPSINKSYLKKRTPGIELGAKDKNENWLRDKEVAKLYHGKFWRRLRDMVKTEEPVCRVCKREPTHTIDHIIPYETGMNFYDRDNLQGLCKRCNARKTGKQKWIGK